MSNAIRIVLADDHAIFRSALKSLLSAEPDLEIVGVAADGQQAIERCTELRPDVLVLDLNMPGMSGLQALPAILQGCPDCRVLVLTMLPEELFLLQVLHAGGSGYVPKSATDTDLIDAIRTVYQGRAYLRPGDVQMLLTEHLRGGQAEQSRDSLGLLSVREREVLELTVRGYSSREIGDRLVISPKTVETYRQRIMDKLELGHRSELIDFALKKGLLR